MTPPPAATHAAPSQGLALRPVGGDLQGLIVRLLDPHAWSRLRFMVDVAVLYLAACAAVFAAPLVDEGSNRWLAACFPLVTLAILYARRSPDERLHASALDTTTHVLGVVSLASMLAIAGASILGGEHPIGLSVRLWLFASVYLGVARCVLMSIRRQAVRSESLAAPTLVVGAGVVGEHVVKRLIDEPSYGLRPVGFLDAHPMPRPDHSGSFVPVLGGPADLADAVARTRARRVILAFSSEPDRVLVDTVKECQQLGIEVSLIPRLYESVNERATLDYVGGVPMLSLRPTDPRGWQFVVKHTLDRTLALLGLIALSPVLLGIALLVRATSPGPALFRQRRVGRDGHMFDVLKFRTMREGQRDEFDLPDGLAPGGVEGDDRRTSIGRLLRIASLDELPQLINVVRGDMSLIGPRPERPEYVERFTRHVARYQDRHRVKSGITGWAQVNGLRGQTSIDDRVEWDNYYIQNWSLRLDLKIALMTVAEILRFRDSQKLRKYGTSHPQHHPPGLFR
jgi:exopolysaccharide biosynthesis polyprenyl glycosylphosphotransferase